MKKIIALALLALAACDNSPPPADPPAGEGQVIEEGPDCGKDPCK